MTAIKSAFSGQTIPAALADAVAKVESASDQQTTKELHSKTAALGQARKQIHAIRKARDAQAASWTAFLQSTTEALDKGSKEFQEKKAELDAQEKEARQRAGAARRAIRELASSSASKVEVVEDSDDISDLEMTDAVVDEEDKMVRAQKRLKTTLTDLLTRIPDVSTDTRRRGAEEKDLPDKTSNPS